MHQCVNGEAFYTSGVGFVCLLFVSSNESVAALINISATNILISGMTNQGLCVYITLKGKIDTTLK